MIAVNVNGDVRLIRGFEEAVKKVGNVQPVLHGIGDVLVREFKGQFPEEGSRLERSRWQPLAPATLEDRARKGFPPGPILTRTGTLREGFVATLGSDYVRVHNDVPYYEYHQLGTPRMPQRRMIVFPERLKQEVVRVFTRFINEALRGL